MLRPVPPGRAGSPGGERRALPIGAADGIQPQTFWPRAGGAGPPDDRGTLSSNGWCSDPGANFWTNDGLPFAEFSPQQARCGISERVVNGWLPFCYPLLPFCYPKAACGSRRGPVNSLIWPQISGYCRHHPTGTDGNYRIAKPLYGLKPYPGFESLRLRQLSTDV
jgi:hypothetical protein